MQNKEKALFEIVSNKAIKAAGEGTRFPLPEVRGKPPPLQNPAPVRLLLYAPVQIPVFSRKMIKGRVTCLFHLRERGFEPLRLAVPDPKSGVYTNFTTPAQV